MAKSLHEADGNVHEEHEVQQVKILATVERERTSNKEVMLDHVVHTRTRNIRGQAAASVALTPFPFHGWLPKQPSLLVVPSAHKTPDLRTLIFARSAGYGLLRGHEHQHASFRSPSSPHLWARQPPQGRHRAQVQRSKGPFLFAFTVLALLRSLTRSDHVGPHRSLQVRMRGSRWTNPLGEWPAECRTHARSCAPDSVAADPARLTRARSLF